MHLRNNACMLITIRKQKKLSQQKLADLIGVNKSTISRLERGLIERPAHEIVSSLARVLKTKPEKLFSA